MVPSVFARYWQAYRALYFFETDENGVPEIGTWGRSVTWQHLLIGSAYYGFLDFTTATMLTGLHLLWWNVQGVTHEWYHVPLDSQRRRHFSTITYHLFNALEYFNIISTRGHWQHHEHDLGNLGGVSDFFDMNALFLNGLDDRAFAFYTSLASDTNEDGVEELDESRLVRIAKKLELAGIPLTTGFNILAALLMANYYF